VNVGGISSLEEGKMDGIIEIHLHLEVRIPSETVIGV
jgi:hypothetical protein